MYRIFSVISRKQSQKSRFIVKTDLDFADCFGGDNCHMDELDMTGLRSCDSFWREPFVFQRKKYAVLESLVDNICNKIKCLTY